MSNAHKWITLGHEGKDATKNNLDSFKAFLLLLKFHCVEKMEIYRTLIKLLHMYNPRDGFEAYSTLIQVICVLLVGIDSNMLNYLLSIIPLPQPCGQYKRIFIQEEIKRISGMSLLSIPAFHSIYTPVTFDKTDECDSLNSISLDSSDEMNSSRMKLLGNEEVKIEEPKLEEYRLIQVTGNASDSLLNDISIMYDAKDIDLSNDSSSDSFDQLVDEESIKINEETEQLRVTDSFAIFSDGNMAKFDLTPSSVLKESINKFIAEAYGSSYIERNGYLDEKSETLTNKGISSSCAEELNRISESTTNSLLSCSNESSSSIMRNDLENDDSDIEILGVEENSIICVKGNDQNGNPSNLKQESKIAYTQTDIEKANNENEALNENACVDLTDRTRDPNKTFKQQMPTGSILPKSQSLSQLNNYLIKDGKGEELKQNEQLKDSFISNNDQSHASTNQNALQTSINNVNVAVIDLASVKTWTKEDTAPSHNVLSDHEWSIKNLQLFDIDLEQNEAVLPNKKDIAMQNDTSTPVTLMPSIPIAHGFKRNTSYTSIEHLLYLHELALSKLAEPKAPSDSDSCITQSTPEASVTENKATRNFSKKETYQEIEAATLSASATIEDTHFKNDFQGSSAESWSTQGRKNSSLLGCRGIITPRLPLKSAKEENISVCSGYDIAKMRSYSAHSLPKSNDNMPVSSLPSPSQLPPPPSSQLPTSSSSSSISLPSSFSIGHSMPPKHLAATDGQEWIRKLPENRKSMESLWPAYRPVYQPYTVYDSRFMQQRVQLSQRPVMIAPPQSSMNPCLEQPHGCVNQYGGRFWGIYSPVAHRMFPRQTTHAVQQQRMSTANTDVVPHFISHPTQRISTNQAVYVSQLSKMSPHIMPQYTSHSAESKCKSLEEIVGRIKENNKQ